MISVAAHVCGVLGDGYAHGLFLDFCTSFMLQCKREPITVQGLGAVTRDAGGGFLFGV